MAGDDRRRPWYMPGDADSSTNLNTRIMIIAIISLSSVILLVLALHIYACCVLARPINRRRAAASRRLALSQSQPGHPQASIVMPKPGLDPAVVAALPILKFKTLTPSQECKDPIECSVCLSLLEDEEMIRQLPTCNHAFHVECIDKWLEFNINCPLCRAEAEPRVLQSSAPPAEVDAQPPPIEVAKSAHAAAASVASTSRPRVLQPSASAPPAEVDAQPPPIEVAKSAHAAAASVASTSRLSSFRRMLSRDRSSRRVQPSAPEVEISDVERQ